MNPLLLVGFGGFFGAIARYKAGGWVSHKFIYGIFPVGTLAVNCLGCLVIGFLVALAERQQWFNTDARLLLITGFLGAFTTFSAFSFDTIFLMRRGEMTQAFLNVGLHVVLCLLFTWVAMRIGERIF